MTTRPAATPKQAAALAKISPTRFGDAISTGVHPSTLAALTRAGYVERRWANSSLRGGEHWVYRLTIAGIRVNNDTRRATKTNRNPS